MNVGPRDDISTFLLRIRRAADDTASPPSHGMIVSPADDAKATDTSANDTGDVDTGGRASAPPADMTIGDTNNPTGIDGPIGLDGTIPMGPSEDTHIVNAADPAGASQPQPPGNTSVDVGATAASSVTSARKRKGRGKHNREAQDERKRQRRAALLLTTQSDTEAGT